jgi:hypothetical protein
MIATGCYAAWAASGCRGWSVPYDGGGRRAIFRDDTDRQNFLRLEAVAEEEDLAVFAYVLMDNHFHVVARRGACSACRPEHNRRPATVRPSGSSSPTGTRAAWPITFRARSYASLFCTCALRLTES